MSEIRSCPGPERLAAFVHGKLAEDESAMTATHCIECEPCGEMLAGFERPRTNTRRVSIGTATVRVVTAGVIAGLLGHTRPAELAGPIEELVKAAAISSR